MKFLHFCEKKTVDRYACKALLMQFWKGKLTCKVSWIQLLSDIKTVTFEPCCFQVSLLDFFTK